jgi:hypothetical protein
MTRPPKKSKAALPDFAEAQRACRTAAEHEQLARAVRDGWTPSELHEYARLFFFKNGRDYPTATSYRRAIADIHSSHSEAWLKLFRKGGSKPLPPRREGLLQRGRGLAEVQLEYPVRRSVPNPVNSEEYAWPGHTEEFRSMIEQRTRDYFKIAPELPVHVNAWAASKRAYDRERAADAEKLRKETEAATFSLVPKSRKKSPGGPRRKLAPQFDDTFWGQKLKPHFDYEFVGHSAAFREEVAAVARKDKGKKPNAYISPRAWKIACHKHYVLIEAPKA